MSVMRTVDLFLHHILSLFIADHDSNVLPRGGAPVRIVIAFLGDLQAPSCSRSILSCVNRQITFELLVSGKQTCSSKEILRLIVGLYTFTKPVYLVVACKTGGLYFSGQRAERDARERNGIDCSQPFSSQSPRSFWSASGADQ